MLEPVFQIEESISSIAGCPLDLFYCIWERVGVFLCAVIEFTIIAVETLNNCLIITIRLRMLARELLGHEV